MDVLDFHAAERAITNPSHPEVLGSWLSCGESPHDFAVVKGPNAKLHHFAFHLEDWNAILRAGDIMSMAHVAIDFGHRPLPLPPRPTISSCAPAGNRNEV